MATELVVTVTGRRLPAGRVVAGLFAGEKSAPAGLPAAVAKGIEAVLRRAGWKGEEGQSAELELGGGRLLLVRGLGKRGDLDVQRLRAWLAQSVDAVRSADDPAFVLVVPDHEISRGPVAAARIAREVAIAGYRFDSWLGRKSRSRLKRVDLLPPEGDTAAWRAGVPVGAAVAAGVTLARDLGNTPPNVATPAWMAAQAARLARRHGAKLRILTPTEMKRRGMGGILAVGGGSQHPPRLVRIEFGSGPRTVALVGKGVTFDTGGISIKPAGQMDEMKWDKSGACTVLGVLETVARLKPQVRVRAYLPLAENMPDGRAYRPGDIVRCANGRTVEILNTDAEGRMILADALAWAASEKPDHLLEYSTLTGACVVALGPTGAGLFTPDDALAGALLAAAEKNGERLWRLPLWREFLEEMRGAHADLRNSGGRWGGASTAAAFLSQFVEPVASWAHLDIAGPAYVGEGKIQRGATGYGIALTVEWLRSLERSARRRRR